MNTKQRQLKFVLDHLESGETLTAVKARCIYGIESLSSRISELKKQGHKIESIEIGGGFVKYELDDNRSFIPDPKFAIKFDIEDDNAPLEREFFDFLKRNDALDSYIELRTANLIDYDIDGFSLPRSVTSYIAAAFTWPDESYMQWCNLFNSWTRKLEELESHV